MQQQNVCIEQSNGNKYLKLVSTDESKLTLKKHETMELYQISY